MNKKWKKRIALVCAFFVAMTGIPNNLLETAAAELKEMGNDFLIFAENEEAADSYSGSCGEDAMWEFDADTGTLIISGSGEMENYADSDEVPWREYRDTITAGYIEYGVTSISPYSLYNCEQLAEISIPESVTSIGTAAFFLADRSFQ